MMASTGGLGLHVASKIQGLFYSGFALVILAYLVVLMKGEKGVFLG